MTKRSDQFKSEPEAVKSRKARPELTQRDKFIQAAREAGCDETGEKLDEALRTIGRAGRAKR